MSDDVRIANLALEVPVRRYRIEAILRQKPKLEAPAEACLRALHVTGRLSESSLARYLGLSVGEFDVVAAELLSQYLVRRSGPDLMLTETGKQAVDPNAEGQRREKAVATLAFEETAFAEAPRGRAKPWMRRMTPREVREDGRPEAAEAFRESFWAWRTRERDSNRGDALARVVNVAPLGKETAVIKAPVTLAPASNAAYIDVSNIELGSLTSASRREACAERFRETVSTALAPDDGNEALNWIAREIVSLPGAPALDPVSWARQARLGELVPPDRSILVSETVPSIIMRNIFPVESDLDDDSYSNDFDPNASDAGIVLWSPPEGEAWHLDADIDSAASQLSQRNRGKNDKMGLVTAIFRLRKGSEREVVRSWDLERQTGPFGAALLSTTSRSTVAVLAPGVGEELPQALELVTLPGRWAIAVAHLSTDRSPIPIPVGIATTDPTFVERVVTILRQKIDQSSDSDWRAQGGPNGAVEAARRVSIATRR